MGSNTYFSAYQVLKRYITDTMELTPVNYSTRSRYCYCTMWVEQNDSNISHFICEKKSPTQFLIWWYDNDYKELGRTSFDYADVNTPRLALFD